MKRYYFSLTARGWDIFDRLGQSGGPICHVEDADVANIICDALNAAAEKRAS